MEEQEVYLLRAASGEIKSLRRANELMAARLEVFDSLMLMFNTSPNRSGGLMSPDLVYEIDKLLESKK